MDRYPRIALTMIVRNAEATLQRCLDSVCDWVDQIVVVDTGSTDGTLQIAQSYSAELRHFQWCDDFSSARNEGLHHIQADWIMTLDADEWLDEKAQKAVLQLFCRTDARKRPWCISASSIGSSARLLKRFAWSGHYSFAFRGYVHEQLYLRSESPAFIDVHDLFISHERISNELLLKKQIFYLSLIQKELVFCDDNKRISELSWHAYQALKVMNKPQESILYLRKAYEKMFETADVSPVLFHYQVTIVLAYEYISLNEFACASALILEAINRWPLMADGWFLKALVDFLSENYNDSENALLKALPLIKTQKLFVSLSRKQLIYQVKWLHLRVLWSLSKIDEAISVLDELIQNFVSVELLAYRLSIAYVNKNADDLDKYLKLLPQEYADLDAKDIFKRFDFWTEEERLRLNLN